MRKQNRKSKCFKRLYYLFVSAIQNQFVLLYKSNIILLKIRGEEKIFHAAWKNINWCHFLYTHFHLVGKLFDNL